MDKLVEQIIKPILEANGIKKVIGIYGGRFQPFGPHHLKTYKWLKSKVDDAYISTSNIKKPPRHPMNFKEKVRHMSKMGVSSSKIIMEKSPYVAKNLEKKFNPKTTAFVYVFGEKDAGRLGGSGKYFQDYKKNKGNIKGYKEHGYYLVAPHVSISVGGKEVSGTTMRELLGSDKYDDKQRAKLFKKMFGYYDEGVFKMMTNKFKKLFESDINVVTWDNTKPKPKNPKHFDKKDRDLLHDIDIPVKVGDTVMMGRFKNKKVVVKSIEFNNKGDLMINGRPALKFRIVKSGGKDVDEQVVKLKGGYRKYKKPKDSDFDEPYKQGYTENIYRGYPNKKQLKKHLAKLIKIRNKLGSNQKYQYHPIKEGSNTSGAGALQSVDSGPSLMFKNSEHYKGRGDLEAEKLGWSVINYIIKNDADDLPPSEFELLDGWPMGPHNSVSYLPAGIGTGKTPNNQENLTGTKGYDKWVRAMKSKARSVGYELIKFTKQDRDTRKQIARDTVDTLNTQKEEEITEGGFSTKWWKKELLKENIVTKTKLKPRRKELLLMGGAYGHMAHPFDDKDLTFGDLKKIITLGLGGQLNREDNVTEKLDGQNIMVSWKDGKLIAARNKGHIKNGGKTALDKKGIASKFKGRGSIRNAFVYAMNDLEKAIKALSDKQKTKIFNNGYNFMNLEVMYPSSANVIDYDVTQLVFHGALKYDDNANVKGEVAGSGRILAGMIQQRNQNIQKKYSIGKPVFLDVPKHQDFGKMKDKFLGRLQKLQNTYALKDNDTLGLYHQKWWESFILKQLKKISPRVLEGLVKRWAFFDKSYKIPQIKKDLKDTPIFLEWVLKTDKENHTKIVKENMKPFETLFFEVGAEILKNVQGYMAANPNKAVQNIRKKLSSAISKVRSGGDLKKLNTLKLQLDKLNTIGGVDSIVPSEGIVFKYNGKTYKFTGAFAPVNQITGLINF
tara:strand:+ start:340 stop:3183 length:2844 start_codon:yes stop_codon:yes gene_type:complete